MPVLKVACLLILLHGLVGLAKRGSNTAFQSATSTSSQGRQTQRQQALLG